MTSLSALPQMSKTILYVLMLLIALLTFVLAWAQIGLLRGRPFRNPDGTTDDWREQKLFFGIAVADLAVAIPAAVAGLVLAFPAPRIGLLVLGAVAFWMVWINLVTTITSLRFEKPRITLAWLIVFPFGILVGLAYLAWLALHFRLFYGAV